MKTPTTRGPLQKWLDFWFAPTDPTMLGFLRIVTGVLVLYAHLAYCFDLQAFFGKNGWYGLDFVNRERREQPTVIPSFFSWDERFPGAHVPEYPHRKAAVMAWLRSLPTDRATLDQRIKFLDRIHRIENDAIERELLVNAQLIGGELTFSEDATVRLAQTTQMVQEKYLDALNKPAFNIPIPEWMRNLPPSGDRGREVYAAELAAFLAGLPREPEPRMFVLNFLIEGDHNARGWMLNFVRDLTAVSPEERLKRLDYMDYWNQEERYNFRTGTAVFSLWFHITDPTMMSITHGVVLVIIVLFTIGFCTRLTSVLTWLVVVSYIHRNQQVLFGMDTMMNILLLYLMIGNSGAALSVDRWLQRYRAARYSLQQHGVITPATRAFLDRVPPSRSANLGLRLLQVHFCFIYMASGLSKLHGAAWWNTNAYWDTLVNPEFTLIHYQWYESLVRGLVSSRPVYQVVAALGVLFTLGLEIALPILVWTRARPYIIIGGFFLHAGIAVFMGLWIFSLMMMSMLLAYIPGAIARERIFGEPSRDRMIWKWSRKRPADEAVTARVVALDFDGQVELVEGDGPMGLAGQSGSSAAKSLLQGLAWTKPFAFLVRVPLLGSWMARCLTGGESAGTPTVRPRVPVSR
jgi:hypothetical protein